ncbi:methylenetetrahydrofolate reductase [Novosphingobium flavum]|uniref:Methylenetetrahydrofolate reductase n=1 Tax=Novosphingobium flavum TaxID=1778672 RepID=A0A7X1FU25_9SPHN|nr:methylenetetrahydrofolate reductase [Novosphingobium flavum]MBC2666994.1 methylenetetrahydrofolate reductase [Novosphingobium flavum]
MNRLAKAADHGCARTDVLNDYSLEITARDVDRLTRIAPGIPAGSQVAVTFLPGESPDARVAAAAAVHRLGFTPLPHFSARRIASTEEFEGFLSALVSRAAVSRCFVVAGDPPAPDGPFHDSLDLIRTGAFERAGIEMLGIGGHPEGHPHMTEEHCFEVLTAKCEEIRRRGMTPLIVTQFGFNPDPVLRWLDDLRGRGIDAPVRIGIPGPAGIKTLLQFAGRCGVEASAAAMAKYGVSLGRLLGTAGPDKLVDALAPALTPRLGDVRLHFYPFGGIERTVQWIETYRQRR